MSPAERDEATDFTTHIATTRRADFAKPGETVLPSNANLMQSWPQFRWVNEVWARELI
jgi:hypothetical protein